MRSKPHFFAVHPKNFARHGYLVDSESSKMPETRLYVCLYSDSTLRFLGIGKDFGAAQASVLEQVAEFALELPTTACTIH